MIMQILRVGSKGPDVEKWQMFLRGLQAKSQIVVTGIFDDLTKNETMSFQRSSGMIADGVVGPKTLSAALNAGFHIMDDDVVDITGPNWPPCPNGVIPLSQLDRSKIFGIFSYVPAPTSSNPEAITITDNWVADNIKTVCIPQIMNVPGSLKSGNIQVHKLVAQQMSKLFTAWEAAGLKDKILTWGGSWAPRYIRGSRTSLSNHSWGTAFDINVQWNALGATPALKGEKGSVRELVEIAYQHGFYWGGHFKSRPDGMHFEAYKLVE